MVLQSLTDGGVLVGIPRELAERTAAHTMMVGFCMYTNRPVVGTEKGAIPHNRVTNAAILSPHCRVLPRLWVREDNIQVRWAPPCRFTGVKAEHFCFRTVNVLLYSVTVRTGLLFVLLNTYEANLNLCIVLYHDNFISPCTQDIGPRQFCAKILTTVFDRICVRCCCTICDPGSGSRDSKAKICPRLRIGKVGPKMFYCKNSPWTTFW